MTRVRSRTAITSSSGSLAFFATSSSVGSRLSFTASSVVVRLTVRSRWAMCAGIRTGRPVLSSPRWIDCLIQSTA